MNMNFPYVVKRQRTPVLSRGTTIAAALQLLREVAEIDEVSASGDACTGYDILQFANIAGPGVLQQGRLRAPSQAGDILAVGIVVLLEEKLHQKRNIFEAFAERRNADLDRAEAVGEIFAKAAGENLCPQIAVGGGDQPNCDLPDLGRAHTLNFTVLNHAQELGLHRQRGLADFVEEYRAAVRIFEKAGTRFRGTGKGAAHVAKELAFEKRVHQRRTVAHCQT